MRISRSVPQMVLGFGHQTSIRIARLCANAFVIFQLGTFPPYLAKAAQLDLFPVHLELQMLVLAKVARQESTLIQRVLQLANYVQQELTLHNLDPLMKKKFIQGTSALKLTNTAPLSIRAKWIAKRGD